MHCLAFARNSRCIAAAAAAVFAVGGDEPSDTLWTALAECRERKLETLVGIETLQTLSAIHGRSRLGWTSFATRSTLADGTSAAHEHYGKAKPYLSLASAAVQFQWLVFSPCEVPLCTPLGCSFPSSSRRFLLNTPSSDLSLRLRFFARLDCTRGLSTTKCALT